MKQEKKHSIVRTVANIVILLFLVVAALYVSKQVIRVINPPYSYEVTRMVTVSDIVQGEGVLLFDEVGIGGEDALLGYLVSDGERVSAGTAVAERYISEEQGTLRGQLQEIDEQIELLRRSEKVSVAQLEPLLSERATALYSLMEDIDRDELKNIQKHREAYLFAQNKIRVTTGEVKDFSAEIAALEGQATELKSRLGEPTVICAPMTGYFVSGQNASQLTYSSEAVLGMSADELQSALERGMERSLKGQTGKIVRGFRWKYCGVCSAAEGAKLVDEAGKPLTRNLTITFPDDADTPMTAKLLEVSTDEERGLTRFVLECNMVNGEVLRLAQARIKIVVGTNTGLRVRTSAIRYLEVKKENGKPEGEEQSQQGEVYQPGVYVKRGNMLYFRKIDAVDQEHPRIVEGDYTIVLPRGMTGSVSELELYDEVVVSGQNLYDGKLL